MDSSPKSSPQTFLTPIAIIIAGIIVAGGIVAKDQIQAKIGGSKPAVAGETTANNDNQNSQQPSQQPEEQQPSMAGITESITADAIIGNKDAKVTIISFSDFACPYCSAAAGQNQEVQDSLKKMFGGWEPAVPNIIKDYVDTGKVRMIFRERPLHGPAAEKDAQAAMCANESGKYVEMADKIFANQGSWSGESDPTDKLIAYGNELGINISDCLKNGKHKGDVDTDNSDGAKANVNGTPTFFVNGTPVIGAQPYSEFKKVIDAALK